MNPQEAESWPTLSDEARTAYERALATDGVLDPNTPAPLVHELMRLGLITATDEGWQAQAPAGPLGRAQHALRVQAEALHQLSGELERAWLRHMVADIPEWRTGAAAGAMATQLLGEAQHTVKGCAVPTRGTTDPLSMPETQEPAMARGVKVYGLYSAEVLDDPVGLEVVRQSIAAGEQARLLQTVPFSFMVVDSRVVTLTPPYEHFETRQAVVLRNPALVHALEQLFDVLWEQGIPLSSEADLVPDREQEERLLVLLAQGHSDRMIARHLGISERTLTRRLTALQERLSARSRFQLGYQAARLLDGPQRRPS